jgi:predicted DNA-binding protein with PD1-like motif
MRYTRANQGRVFVVRLEEGDVLHESIEELARREGVHRAVCLGLGGVQEGGRLVVGPEHAADGTFVPQVINLDGIHEFAAVGTLFPNESGEPVVHMHAACGRGESSRVGCVRVGVETWLVGEIVVIELLDCEAVRVRQKDTGFELLTVRQDG